MLRATRSYLKPAASTAIDTSTLALEARVLVVSLGHVHLREDSELHGSLLRPRFEASIRSSRITIRIFDCQSQFSNAKCGRDGESGHGPEEATRGSPEVRSDLYRHHILEAAEDVFAERGFEAAKLQEISAACGLSMGTIYAIFPGKEELFRALLEERGAELLRARARRGGARGSGAGSARRPHRSVRRLLRRAPDVPAHASPARRLVGARPGRGERRAPSSSGRRSTSYTPRSSGAASPTACSSTRSRRSSRSSSRRWIRSCSPIGRRTA